MPDDHFAAMERSEPMNYEDIHHIMGIIEDHFGHVL
jgi:hypothetical protein